MTYTVNKIYLVYTIKNTNYRCELAKGNPNTPMKQIVYLKDTHTVSSLKNGYFSPAKIIWLLYNCIKDLAV